MQLYDKALYEALRRAENIVDVGGARVNIKPIPDDDRPGVPDPRELAVLLENAKQPRIENPTIADQRNSMGFPNRNLNTVEIYAKYEELMFGGNTVGLWRYYPRKPEGKKNRPALLYIHGGGWMGGTPYTVENPCRLLAERADAVVFNIDYSLAPEKPFPHGFNDCWAALVHIHTNAEAYGIDRQRIGVGGDSAGGNLSAALATKDRDMGTHIIQYQALIYPMVTFRTYTTPGYRFALEDFEMADEYRDILMPGVIGLSHTAIPEGAPMHPGYLPHQDDMDSPYASPMLSPSFAGLPKTLVATAEFCGLRTQGEQYAALLQAAGVDVRTIRYKGSTHAFLDKLGVFPQAEDLVQQMADDLLAL
ncbi:MAG: alpha/beta hydrolase [Eubacteriales bacterium]|nr:alpha/beta hydrolase [Eubacteriales bacterium]